MSRLRSPAAAMVQSPLQTLPFLLLLLLPLLLLSLAPAAAGAAFAGLDAFLLAAAARDPSASNDTFGSLPASLRRALAAPSPILPSRLLSLSANVPVNVRLGGSSFPASSARILPSLISSAVSSSHFLSSRSPHRLALSHNIHLDVAAPAASSELATRAGTAVRAHLDASPAPFHSSALSSVPYSVVDDLVAEDYRRLAGSASAPAVYIYLLDLGKQPRPYAYTAASSSADAQSPGFSRCLAPVWAGKERYIWIDLGAGPVDYGPALSGDGVLPRGEFHPLAALHGRPKSEKALLADLASLVLSAYKSLLVPSLRIPVHYESSLLIRFVHIHGDEKDPAGLDWGLIEQSIQDGDLLYDGQSLKFDRHSVKYSECPICSFTIARSTHSFTSRFLFDNYTLIVSEYLDSKRMRQVLSDSSEEMHRVAGVHDDGDYDKVVPVYVFDLDYDKLLMLDRYHQAVAFRDMVVAVRTRSSQTVSDYSCNGRHVITMTRNLERPIISSVLQTMFGVSPTHQSWSPEHNATVVDYTWSTGHTPFGPFSETKSLSFVQKDAARRNVLLTTLNYTITSTIDVLESMAAHGGENILLRKKRHVEFIQRWNLLTYKLEKVVSAMSRLDYKKAMYFLRSSDHDMYAVYMLVYQASQELEASLICFKDTPFPWLPVSMSGVFVFGFFYVYSKRDKLFRSKRKQF
ncbi:uncharacterized protein LOC100821666 [Brachypodium distachyon]|uniref:DUF7906 domain-containing protein n=1 Tax=Brachypodium distachyon TaxID=15368 RepID=A0A0Q3JJV4_BRADI|nr:uncharacterized protein LOC100821666 [Brachypodium distachyon]XP_024313371.1 uncharacterized protein LOC100821666 [Brachypodium distachyon]KQK17867.1 hypothetical protein BRADI_1g37270v3 [Brachypodium distachyon]PNT75717.1 hypothetical protein BRADI_1g37270v3 [Brachypodium distachyon]|eukprot:XP_003560633.1 uncharacterized protein LOC100821666 [Brachypodium distachyon]